LQGPALYAYNNAQFRNEDWDGIRRLNDSIKRNDNTKIGRFGVGFKSVFHMTGMILLSNIFFMYLIYFFVRHFIFSCYFKNNILFILHLPVL